MERTLADLKKAPGGGGGGGGGCSKERIKREVPVDDDADDEEEEQLPCQSPPPGAGGVADNERKRSPSSPSSGTAAVSAAAPCAAPASRRGGGSGGGGLLSACCQAEMCTADLTEAKRYHRRHKVCETHAKAAVVMVAGLRQRFCQQCSRFHELSEFDESKRSCRRRLAGHNERRRKTSSESQGEGSNRCRQVDQSGRMQVTLAGSSTYKNFQIR